MWRYWTVAQPGTTAWFWGGPAVGGDEKMGVIMTRLPSSDAEKVPVGTEARLGIEINDIAQRTVAGEISEYAVVAEGEERTTWFVWLLVCCCTISGLLFGYDTGVISGALVTINSDWGPFELSNEQKEFITSATTLGALLGGLAVGTMSDWTGQALSHTVWSIVGCRFLISIGVGLASCIAPLYIQELSPTRLRGRMVVLNVVMITLGQVITYGIDVGFANVNAGWRWMVGLGTVPAAIQLALLVYLPESPRVLVKRGNMEAAKEVLSRVYAFASSEQVDLKLKVLHATVKQSIETANSTTFWQRFSSVFSNPINCRTLGRDLVLAPRSVLLTRKARTVIGCGMQAFQQLCGFNMLMYYSASLFQEIVFNQPTAVGLIVSGINFLFTLFALKIGRYIDVVGWRRIMVFSVPGMVFGLTLASIAFHYMTTDMGSNLVTGAQYSQGWAGIVLLSVIIFVASYATGLGNVPWQQGELFSLDVRGIGTSLSTATNWAANFLIGSTHLSLMSAITSSGAFGFYAGLCLIGWLFCVFCFPDVSGLSLEEV
ncbi:general substrate transporter [Pisolithus marmoratus]|nr:general substrate transporter [Pisolithus marmoratus]